MPYFFRQSESDFNLNLKTLIIPFQQFVCFLSRADISLGNMFNIVNPFRVLL